MIIMAAPYHDDNINPYTSLLYSAISAEPGVEVRAPGAGSRLRFHPGARSALGGEWVDLLDGPLDTAHLEEALQWSDNPRPPQLDLGQYEWHRVAARTLAFYRSLSA